MKQRSSQIEAVLLNIEDPNETLLKGQFTQQPMSLDVEFAYYASMSNASEQKKTKLDFKPLTKSEVA